MDFVGTNGWDTVYALHFNSVNDAIKKKASSPKSFSEERVDEDGTTKIEGTFSDWKLIPGGDGKTLFMELPMSTAALTFANNTDTLTNSSATIEVNLTWAGDQKLDLTAATQSLAVRSINNTTLSEVKQDQFRGLLEKWLIENGSQFNHVFASVEINEVADKDSFQWLKPTGNPSYAVADSDKDSTPEKSIFAVLCMTENRTSPGTHQVSPNAIPDGVNSGFLIAPQRVVENIFKPFIHILFQGATSADFVLENSGLTIENNKNLTFPLQKVDGHSDVTPTVATNNFKLNLKNTTVELTLQQMTFEWSPGITVEVDHTSIATIGMNDKQQLTLMVTKSSTNADVHTSTGVLVAQIMGSIGGALLGAAIGGFIGGLASGGGTAIAEGATEGAVEAIEMTATEGTENAVTNVTNDVAYQAFEEVATQQPGKFATFFATNWTKMLGAAVGLVVGATIGAIPEIIKFQAEKGGEGMPSMKTFGDQALKSVTWPNTTPDGYTLKSLQLNESLQLGIQVEFK